MTFFGAAIVGAFIGFVMLWIFTVILDKTYGNGENDSVL